MSWVYERKASSTWTKDKRKGKLSLKEINYLSSSSATHKSAFEGSSLTASLDLFWNWRKSQTLKLFFKIMSCWINVRFEKLLFTLDESSPKQSARRAGLVPWIDAHRRDITGCICDIENGSQLGGVARYARIRTNDSDLKLKIKISRLRRPVGQGNNQCLLSSFHCLFSVHQDVLPAEQFPQR